MGITIVFVILWLCGHLYRAFHGRRGSWMQLQARPRSVARRPGSLAARRLQPPVPRGCNPVHLGCNHMCRGCNPVHPSRLQPYCLEAATRCIHPGCNRIAWRLQPLPCVSAAPLPDADQLLPGAAHALLLAGRARSGASSRLRQGCAAAAAAVATCGSIAARGALALAHGGPLRPGAEPGLPWVLP